MSSHKDNTLLRSFARRIGKGFSPEQQSLLRDDLPEYNLNQENPLSDIPANKKIFLEIGCGMGENIINHAIHDQDNVYIGCEPYLNGVANCLKIAKRHGIKNIKLWPDDVDLVVENIPNNSLDGVTVLFPDPWHKRRHNKRRIMNEQRLQSLYRILKIDGVLYFGTDIEDYFEQVVELFEDFGDLQVIKGNGMPPHYTQTKYHHKAIQEGRVAQFVCVVKN